MKDQAERRSAAASHAAHPMPHRDAMKASCPAPRPLLDRDDCRGPLLEGHHDRTRLYAGTLLHENKLPALELRARLAEQHDHLQRKVDRPVEVLVKAGVVAFSVAEEQRGGAPVAAGVA